ncbi:H-NS histone family protein [Comamonas aquatica]|uniref:H-NS histone family protein n=1 Tax=Comamonas aquatica TaxID=225991 RepID=UPI0009F17B6A|nr:H-NS histone family protein [Comamonas aquatica]
MSSLAEIQKQIAELQAQAKAIIENEKHNVIEEIKAKISQYGITANDLGFKFFDNIKPVKPSSGAGTSKAPSIAMYKNTESNETWHGGKGARPKWIQAIFDKQLEINKEFNQADLHKYLEENGYKI